MSSKVVNVSVQKLLESYMSKTGKTLKQVGKSLGYSESMVSRYFSDNPAGDISAFESAVTDMLAAEDRDEQWQEIYFKTHAVEECYQIFDLIRASRDVGVLGGEPGVGKTIAAVRYKRDNSTTILVSVPKWSAGDWGLQRLIWDQLDTRKHDPSEESKADHLTRRLSGSDRLLIIDNAQRIYVSGLQWLLDFADLTRCPVALVGNPKKILDRLRSDPALSSRIGIRKEISSSKADKDAKAWLSDASDAMVIAMWPQALAEIKTLAREAAMQPGHLRRLNKQLRIAIRLSESPTWGKSMSAAFAYSRTLLVDDGKDD